MWISRVEGRILHTHVVIFILLALPLSEKTQKWYCFKQKFDFLIKKNSFLLGSCLKKQQEESI
jgi:hypothetical protein